MVKMLPSSGTLLLI